MPTKRTPINRQARQRITPVAVEAFRKMKAARERCVCDDEECEACDEWWTLHQTLHRELSAKPWEFPCIVSPDEPCVFPAGTAGAAYWPTAQALYRALDEACK
jgi:hypothetical protein